VCKEGYDWQLAVTDDGVSTHTCIPPALVPIKLIYGTAETVQMGANLRGGCDLCDKGPGGECHATTGDLDGYTCGCKEGYDWQLEVSDTGTTTHTCIQPHTHESFVIAVTLFGLVDPTFASDERKTDALKAALAGELRMNSGDIVIVDVGVDHLAGSTLLRVEVFFTADGKEVQTTTADGTDTITTTYADGGSKMVVTKPDGSTATVNVGVDGLMSLALMDAGGAVTTTSADGKTVSVVDKDGSTTTTRVNADGSVIITGNDGSTHTTNAVPNVDGSTTATLADGTTITVSANGKVVTTTDADGTVSVATTSEDGSSKMVMTKPDGSMTTTGVGGVGGSAAGGGGRGGGTRGTQTSTAAADGTVTTTSADGKTVSAVDKDGSTIRTTIVNADGSVSITGNDGSTHTTNAVSNVDGSTTATLADGTIITVTNNAEAQLHELLLQIILDPASFVSHFKAYYPYPLSPAFGILVSLITRSPTTSPTNAPTKPDPTLAPTSMPTGAPTVAPSWSHGPCHYGFSHVQNGWRGPGPGMNFCNSCVCDHAELKCTKRSCSLPSESGPGAHVTECKKTRCVYSSCRSRVFPAICNDETDEDSAAIVVQHHHADSSPHKHLLHGKMHKCTYSEYKKECKCLCIDVNSKDPATLAGVGKGPPAMLAGVGKGPPAVLFRRSTKYFQ
jgi:hypothetical protein